MAGHRAVAKPFFGRRGDVEAVLARVHSPGLTAVVGRPQIGKTRLLEETRDRLRRLDDSRPLVGYFRATSDTRNHLLYALRDLNVSDWLPNAGFVEQGRRLWRGKGDQFISKFGQEFGRSIGPFLRVLDPSGGLKDIVGSTFDALYRADTELRTGGLGLQPIAADEACALARLLHELSGRPLVLILDAFEQQAEPARELGLLRTLLSDIDDWPLIHILLAARQPGEDDGEDETFIGVQRLRDGYSPVAALHELAHFDLRDLPERDSVLQYMRKHVPAMNAMSDDQCLATVGGNPGVLGRIVQGRPQTREELKKIADDARNFHYPEVPRVLAALRSEKRELFNLAIRLAMLPEIDSAEAWRLLEPAFSLGQTELADLFHEGLTEDGFFPVFGHTKRYDTIRHVLIETYAADVSREATRLVMDLAGSIRTGGPDELPLVLTILAMWKDRDRVRLDEQAVAVATLFAAGFNLTSISTATVRRALQPVTRGRPITAACSMMLVNTLHDAKDENDLARRDALLEELRTLHRSVPEDAAVREQLAKGLFNTLYDMKDEDDLARRDALLEELRTLHRSVPEDSAVRERLANGLALRGLSRLGEKEGHGCGDLREAVEHFGALGESALAEHLEDLIAEHCESG